MFFMISAFLMYGSFDRLVLRSNGQVNFRQTVCWIAKRFVRLMPLWYLSIAVHMATNGWHTYWLGSEGKVTVWNLLSHAFFLHGLFPYYMDLILGVDWYVGVIAVLIVFMPLAHKLVKSLSSAVMIFLGIVLMLPHFVSLLYAVNPLPAEDAYIWETYAGNFGFWNQLPVMMLGIILYLFLKQAKELPVKRPAVTAFPILCLGLVLMYGIIFKRTRIWPLDILSLFGISYALVFLSQHICSLRIVDNPVTDLLANIHTASTCSISESCLDITVCLRPK